MVDTPTAIQCLQSLTALSSEMGDAFKPLAYRTFNVFRAAASRAERSLQVSEYIGGL